MSLINISSVFVKNPTDLFPAPYNFTVVVETLKELPNLIEFKFVYIGSAKSDKFDQTLDTFEVGPLPLGVSQFDCDISAPDPSKIPPEDLLGVTALMCIACFKGKEFFRVGYYVYNNVPEFEGVEGATVDISQIDIRKIQRSILSDKPKIIHNQIDWEEQEKEMVLLSEMMGGNQEPLKMNQNLFGFSDSSINFSGLFDSGIKKDSNDLFAKPTQTTFGSSPFGSFGGNLFGNSGTNGSMLNSDNGSMLNMNNQNGFSLFSNNTNQFQQPFTNQQFGTMGIQQEMLPQQQQQTGYFDLQNNGFTGGMGSFNQQQQSMSQGMGGMYSGLGQNFQ